MAKPKLGNQVKPSISIRENPEFFLDAMGNTRAHVYTIGHSIVGDKLITTAPIIKRSNGVSFQTQNAIYIIIKELNLGETCELREHNE